MALLTTSMNLIIIDHHEFCLRSTNRLFVCFQLIVKFVNDFLKEMQKGNHSQPAALPPNPLFYFSEASDSVAKLSFANLQN